MRLTGEKVAILVDDLYEDLELWYPYYRLQEAGADVDTIGTDGGSYSSKHGYEVTVDYSVDGAFSSNYDAVVVPGGWAPDKMRRYRPMITFVEEVHDRGGICAAICHGGWMLASADLLEGKRCTSFRSIRDDLENAGAAWVDEEVVRDGQLVTSREPDDLPAFCRTLIAAIEES